MDREKAKALLPIIQAFSEGKTIQSRCITDEMPLWWDDNNPTFKIDDFDYRIKPEPRYRPFKNAEECWNEMQKHQPFGWVKYKDGSTTNKFMFICDISDKEATFNNCIEFTYYSFLEDYVFADGTPFGVLEEE